LWEYWEGDAYWLESVIPEYIEVDGWQQSIRTARTFNELPPAAQEYIQQVETLAGVRVGSVSVGPNRDETIWVR
jgi:adenylosuccinate synthase